MSAILPYSVDLGRPFSKSTDLASLKMHFYAFSCNLTKIKNPVNEGFTGFCISLQCISAERMGFEPMNHFWRLHTFQACAFDHSAISPITVLNFRTQIYKKNPNSLILSFLLSGIASERILNGPMCKLSQISTLTWLLLLLWLCHTR